MIEICSCLQFCYSYILLVIKTVCFLITICWIISPNKKYFAQLITISPLHIAWHIKERQSNGIVGTTVQHPSVKWQENSINHQDNFVCCNVILRVFFNQGSCCSVFFIPHTEAQCSPCRTFSSQHTGGYCHWGSCHCTASSTFQSPQYKLLIFPQWHRYQHKKNELSHDVTLFIHYVILIVSFVSIS